MHKFSYLFSALQALGARRVALLAALLFLNSLLEGLGLATLVPLFALLLGDEGSSLPPLARYILDFMENMGLPTDTWLLALLAAGFLILAQIIAFLIQTWAGFTITDMALKLRRRMLSAILKARWPWFHDQQTGGLAITIAQFTTHASYAMELAVLTVALALRTLVYIGLVIIISPMLALLIVAAATLLYGPLLVLVRLMQKYSTKFVHAIEQLGATFTDIFGSIKAIRAMGLQDPMARLLDRLIRRLRRYRRRTVLTTYGLAALQNILAIIFVFSVLALAVNVLNISLVEVGVVAGLSMSVVKNLAKAQTRLQKVAEYSPYLERINTLIHSARGAEERHRGTHPPTLEREIALRDVHFAHPQRTVLRDLSLVMPARRISVLTGSSGAGKTTIIDLILGLLTPEKGDVRVDGVPLSEIDMRAWRRMIGYVPQELVLLSGTVRENIALGADIPEEDVWRALRLAGAEEFVRALPDGLDTDLGERGMKLSGGQRQRLSLARALARRPRLLILDEVTSALDPETERKLVSCIGHLARQERLTVIAITHTPAWRGVADHIFHLQAGNIREEDRSEDAR